MNSIKRTIFTLLFIICYLTSYAQIWKEVSNKTIVYVSNGKTDELVELIQKAVDNEGSPSLKEDVLSYFQYIQMAYEKEDRMDDYDNLVSLISKNLDADLSRIKAEEGEFSETYFLSIVKAISFSSTTNTGNLSEYQQEMTRVIMAKSRNETSQPKTNDIKPGKTEETQKELIKEPSNWSEMLQAFKNNRSDFDKIKELYDNSTLKAPTNGYNEDYSECLYYLYNAYSRTGNQAVADKFFEKRARYEEDFSPAYASIREQRQQNEEAAKAQEEQEEAEESESVEEMTQQISDMFGDLLDETTSVGDFTQNDSNVKDGMDQRMDVSRTDKMDAQMDASVQNMMQMGENLMNSSMVDDLDEDQKAQMKQYMQMAEQSQNMSYSERLQMANQQNGASAEQEEEQLDLLLAQLGISVAPNASMEEKRALMDAEIVKQQRDWRETANNSEKAENDPVNIREITQWLKKYLWGMEWIQEDHVSTLKSIQQNHSFHGSDTYQITSAFGLEYVKNHDKQETDEAKEMLTKSLDRARKLITDLANEQMKEYRVSNPQLANYQIEIENDILLDAFVNVAVNKEEAKAYTDIVLEVYSDVGNLVGINELGEKNFSSEKVKIISKNRQAQLNVYTRLLNHAQFEFDPFNSIDGMEELSFNQLIQTKGIDYITNKFIFEGVVKGGDASLERMYSELRSLRKKTGYMYLMSSEERAKANYSDNQFKADLKRVSELEKDLYLQVSVRSSFADFQKDFEISWEEIQTLISQDQAFLDIERVERLESSKHVNYLLTVITKNEKPKTILIGNEEFSGKENYFKLFWQNSVSSLSKPQTDYKDASIFNTFWKDIDPELSGIKELFVSTDGVYNLMSLEAIYNPDREKFLIDEMAISRLSFVAEIKEKITERNKKLNKEGTYHLFGNPDFKSLPLLDSAKVNNKERSIVKLLDIANVTGEDGLDQLPGAEIEVKSLDRLLLSSGIKSLTYIGKDATEEAFNAIEGSKVIHLATHGYFNESKNDKEVLNPLDQALVDLPLFRSQVFLAGAETLNLKGAEPWRDGILTAEEIFHKNLIGTDLVVLSACETGKGEQVDGAGVFGLVRAFKLAGTENVIMSLWPVSDEATELLMTTFYSNMIEKDQSVNEAFSNARKKVREVYLHPGYWSAFILI